MSNPGEWIDFAELCRRVKLHGLNKSPRTLRRYYKDERLISYRQARKGAPVEFNWKTVERELRAMDTQSAASSRIAAMPEVSPELVREVRELKELIEGIAFRLNSIPGLNGIPAGLFASEQKAHG